MLERLTTTNPLVKFASKLGMKHTSVGTNSTKFIPKQGGRGGQKRAYITSPKTMTDQE